MDWIKVSDELPYEGMTVLVTVRNSCDRNDYYTTVCSYGYCDSDGNLDFTIFDPYYQDDMVLSNVVAWMPMPKPYRET